MGASRSIAITSHGWNCTPTRAACPRARASADVPPMRPILRRNQHWRNLIKRSKILSLTKASQAPLKSCFKTKGGGYETLDADRPSHVVCTDPLGLDPWETCMADES